MKSSDRNRQRTGSAGDTVVSYILGILSTVFILLSVIKSILSKGAVERIYGVLMISAFLMTFTGIVFGVSGYHAEEGNVTSKKTAVYLNIVLFVLSGIFFMKGL